MRTSEVLNKAADLIEEWGWGTGPVSIMGKGGLCLMGAVYAAEVGATAHTEAAGINGFAACDAGRAVYEYLAPEVPTINFVFRYNDAVGRTASEVIEVLRACALIEAAREDQDAAEATYAKNLAAAS